MDMTPQGFPLVAWTDEGEQVLVVGWTAGSAGLGGGVYPAPVVVRLDGRCEPEALEGAVAYALPPG